MQVLETFLCVFIVTIILIYIVNNLKEQPINHDIYLEDDNIMNYYFNNYTNIDNLSNNKIFIHLPYERNERKWINFGSRSSKELNNDLIVLSVRSIIKTCGHKYNIILYDNHSVKQLINDDNNSDLCNINNPEMLSGVDLKQWESYCKAKILYKYGGIVMSPYFIFKKCPSEYNLFPNKFTIANLSNEGMNVSNKKNIPTSCYIISAPKNNKDVMIYTKYLEMLCTNHYTVDHKKFDKSFEQLYLLNSYNPKLLGNMDSNDKQIYVSDLIDNKKIDLMFDHFCVFINMDVLKKSTKLNWILRLDEEEIKQSNTFIGKYINLL